MAECASRVELERYGQSHLLQFYDELVEERQRALDAQLDGIDLASTLRVFEQFAGESAPEQTPTVEPLPADKCGAVDEQSAEERQRLWDLGLASVARGEVAACVLAGGQATRLGAALPKGALPIDLPSPTKTLLQLQAAQLSRLQYLASQHSTETTGKIQWLIMTSASTLSTTKQHLFEDVLPLCHLTADQVHLFTQADLPAFGLDGKLLLAAKDSVAVAPNGNGGLYAALQPLLPTLRAAGVKYVHVYCVDNILVRVADPLFVGFCVDRAADCANKVVEKSEPDESIGVVCLVDGSPHVVEYSEMPADLSAARDHVQPEKLKLRAGNIASHLFTVDFLTRVCGETLPYHRALKKVPYVDESGEIVKPTAPNAVKMERFVFDVFRFSENFHVWSVGRADEFSPLKNADSAGKDCAATCRRDLFRLHRRWLDAAGARIDAATEGADHVQVSPFLSYSGEGLTALLDRQLTAPAYVCASDELVDNDAVNVYRI